MSPVLLTVYCHTSYSHFCTCSENTDSNLSSVSHQNLLDWFDILTCWAGGKVGYIGQAASWPPTHPRQVLGDKREHNSIWNITIFKNTLLQISAQNTKAKYGILLFFVISIWKGQSYRYARLLCYDWYIIADKVNIIITFICTLRQTKQKSSERKVCIAFLQAGRQLIHTRLLLSSLLHLKKINQGE